MTDSLHMLAMTTLLLPFLHQKWPGCRPMHLRTDNSDSIQVFSHAAAFFRDAYHFLLSPACFCFRFSSSACGEHDFMQKKGSLSGAFHLAVIRGFRTLYYIMPPMPPMSGIAGFSGSGLSAITASVVRNKPATEAAYCNAERVTFAGSTIPASNMLTHSPVAAL